MKLSLNTKKTKLKLKQEKRIKKLYRKMKLLLANKNGTALFVNRLENNVNLTELFAECAQ